MSGDWAMTPDGREAKLPAWARRLVDTLRRRVEGREVEVAALRDDPGHSASAFCLVLAPGGAGFTEVPLHSDQVRFKLPNGGVIDAHATFARSSHYAQGLALNGISDSLAVRPEAANALVVETRRER